MYIDLKKMIYSIWEEGLDRGLSDEEIIGQIESMLEQLRKYSDEVKNERTGTRRVGYPTYPSPPYPPAQDTILNKDIMGGRIQKGQELYAPPQDKIEVVENPTKDGEEEVVERFKRPIALYGPAQEKMEVVENPTKDGEKEVVERSKRPIALYGPAQEEVKRVEETVIQIPQLLYGPARQSSSESDRNEMDEMFETPPIQTNDGYDGYSK